jgi:sigma-B regulation protein RsbU (phosphoserine phosphatase)
MILPTPPEEILIVDDTPANLKLLSQILTDQGYKVRVAVNGAQALASIGLAVPDLILLDVKMPGIDGFEVCRQLKANPKTNKVPVIFISALDDLKDKLEGFSVGGVDYISKPFQIEEVKARVESLLFIRRAQQILEINNKRMQRELNLAGHLQKNFLPQKFIDVEGWEISAALQPALETSGDFYDLFRLADGKIAILIADVVDKGVSAALLMVLAWALLRERILSYPEQPEAIFSEVNQQILSILQDLEYVTAFLGILTPQTGKLIYANAGHNPPIIFQSREKGILQLNRTGMPLGLSEETQWTQATAELNVGDVLLLYTDGLTEACNLSGEFSGLDRLINCVGPVTHHRAHEIKNHIENELQAFLSNHPPQDDMTLMVLKRVAEPKQNTQPH